MCINDNAKAVILHDLEERIKEQIKSIAFTEEELARKNEEIDRVKASLSSMMVERDDMEKEIDISRQNIADLKQAIEAFKESNKQKDEKDED